MRQHEGALQFGEPRIVDAGAREQAKARVDAVNGLAGRDHAVDACRRRIDTGTRPRVEIQRRRRGPQCPQIREGERTRTQRERQAHRLGFLIVEAGH